MNKEHVQVNLTAAADKTAAGPGGDIHHVVFTVKVSEPLTRQERPGITVALVLDRSGSMHGGKMKAAKEAARLVIGSLDERDEASITSFDDTVDILVPRGRADERFKNRVLSALSELEARGSTALHAGWLAGCRSIAQEEAVPEDGGHCFLLTDGLANVGQQDPEIIASEAAGVRANAGIRTSTFGIGEDYDEALLAPMAVAGGGRFHHLRRPEEIADTFTGELAELFQAAARNVRIEMVPAGEMSLDMISDYYLEKPGSTGGTAVDIGSLMAGEERHLVLRCALKGFEPGRTAELKCRITWTAGETRYESGYGELVFDGRSQAEVDALPADREVLHWTGLHHAARTKRLVMGLLRRGEAEKSRSLLHTALRHLKGYAGDDAELLAAVRELEALEPQVDLGHVDNLMAKEAVFESLSYSRHQMDFRKER